MLKLFPILVILLLAGCARYERIIIGHEPIMGHVYDESGVPFPGVYVTANYRRHGGFWSGYTYLTRGPVITDSNGYFDLPPKAEKAKYSGQRQLFSAWKYPRLLFVHSQGKRYSIRFGMRPAPYDIALTNQYMPLKFLNRPDPWALRDFSGMDQKTAKILVEMLNYELKHQK